MSKATKDIKPKVKPMTADPLGVTARMIGAPMDPSIILKSGHRDTAYGDAFAQLLPAVMVVQAINRLTEAVQESTAARRRK